MKYLLVKFLIFCLINIALCKSDEWNYCRSKACLLDTVRLHQYAGDDDFIKPCDNFMEFSLGKFIKIYPVLDTKVSKHRKRQRNVLQAKVKESEIKINKIAKNFFQKCMDASE